MEKRGFLPALLVTALLLGAMGAGDVSAAPRRADRKSNPEPKAAPASPAAENKPVLGDGFIVQNTVRIYLARPSVITLHNARGQQLFHMESARPTEVLPLNGVDAGFLYLTLRAGSQELTKKLVYSGK